MASTIVIGFVAGTNAGKSHYLAALINQIRNGAELIENKFRVQTGIGDTDDWYRQNYYEPLFGKHETIGHTDSTKALIYQCQDLRDGTAHNLVFFDVAGEVITNQQRRPELGWLFNADGLIALIDPYRLESIREPLERNHAEAERIELEIRKAVDVATGTPSTNGKRRLPAVASTHPGRVDTPAGKPESLEKEPDSSAVVGPSGGSADLDKLNWVSQAADGAGTPEPGQQPIPTRTFASSVADTLSDLVYDYNTVRHDPTTSPVRVPVSIVISKADELRLIREIGPTVDRLLGTSAGRYELHQILTRSAEVRDRVLATIAEPGLMVGLRDFENATYHVASATGCAPFADGFRSVHPMAVTEALASILLRLSPPPMEQ